METEMRPFSQEVKTASAAAMAEYIVVDLMGDVCVRGKSPKEAAQIAEERLLRYYKKKLRRVAPKKRLRTN
jgi:beta-glucosidase/6-phospho-beta-glucosidase/beta-galactosidase